MLVRVFYTFLLFLIPLSAFAVTPRDCMDRKHGEPENFMVVLQPKTQMQLMTQVMAELASDRYVTVGVTYNEFVINSPDPNEEQLINYLDETANTIISQFPESVQSTLHQAYYYNEGLDVTNCRRSSVALGELPFGHPKVTVGERGFTMTWPDYLSSVPVLDKLLKLDAVILRLGTLLSAIEGVDKPLDRVYEAANQKEYADLLYFAYSSQLYRDLLLYPDIFDQNRIKLEPLAPQDDFEAISRYLMAQTRPSEWAQFRAARELESFAKKRKTETVFNGLETQIKGMLSLTYQKSRAMGESLQKDLLLSQRIEQIRRTLKKEVDQFPDERSRSLFLDKKNQLATKANDQMTIYALDQILGQGLSQCMRLLSFK